MGGSEGISLAQSGSCKIGDKTYPAGETIIGTVRANGKEIWRCSGGKFVPCDTCGYTDLTVVPAYAQNIINTEKPCYSKSGLAIAHGETADRHISRTTGEWVVNRCVNGRWVEDATTDVATIRPAYETLGRPELRSCIAGGQIIALGSTTHTATGLQICRNGELSEAQCVPGISFCQEGTRSFCDDRGFVVYQNCQNGCNEVTGACSTTPGETPEKATTVAGKCSGPNDASCNGFCSPTPYGYYCMETDFEQLRDLRCSGNYLQGQEPNGAWTTLKKCNALAGGCSVSGDSYSCTTDVEVEEIIAQQEREKEQVLSECRSTCANSIQGDTIGTCVLRESDSGTGFAAECVRQPSGLAVQSIGNFRGYGSYGGGSCGGIGQQCCNSSTTYTNTDLRGQACNTGLACGTDNTCLVNQAAQIANATATLIRDQNVNADQVISLVQLNQSITNSDAFYAALAQNSGNLCQNCSDGQCLYSSSGDSPGFRCVATEDIENYYREQNPDSKGTGSRELAGELGQDCRRGGLLWLSRVCNHDWLTCGTSNKCELTTSARAIVGNESVTSGDTEADYINTILLPQAGIQNQETAYELARLACSNNGEFFVKYGRCWECLNSNTNAITGREMAFCTGTNSLRQSLPGYQCRNAGGYCAPEDVVGNDGISSVGSANDCNIGFSCVTRAEGNTAQADVNDYCYENQRAAGTDSYKECAPGLVCHNNYCQDKTKLAYVPDYANSAAATQIEEFIPLLKFFVGPQIRTLDPTYYESTNIRAQDMLWVQQNLQTNRDELFTENPDLEEINLESALFEGLDEAAQARAVC